MFYTIITIGLVFLSAFIFLPRFKNFVENYNIGINFFLTLIATLIGVLLAISITNYDSEQKEKQDVIKLLKSTITSVETCFVYSDSLIKHFDKLSETDKLKENFYVNNPLPYPEYLDIFLMQNIVSKNLSGATLSKLNELLINLKRTRNHKTSLYRGFLNNTVKLLELEVDFQKEEINEVQLESQFNITK